MSKIKNIWKKESVLKRIKLQLKVFIFITLFTMAIMLSFYSNAKAQNYSNLNKYSFKKNIHTHKLAIKSNIIYKLNTALGYVSIITLPTIPLNVAIGNAGAFSEQIVGNQIFIKPITYNLQTTTNLEILTKYGLINMLVRITSPHYVTYNLNLAATLNNVFIKNYIESKIKEERNMLRNRYNKKIALVNKEKIELIKQKKKIMNLILTINRIKIDKSVRKNGIILTIISISRIRKLYYLQYQITNTNNLYFFVRNIYLYTEKGGSFFNGYNPTSLGEVYLINKTPHNKKYMAYKIVKNVAIFKRSYLKNGRNLKLSVHILIHNKLIKLSVNNISK
jgi:hypothetical protein